MRTAHSTTGQRSEPAAAGAAHANLEPVLLLASPGPETDLLMRLLDHHPAVHAKGDVFPAPSGPDETYESSLASFAAAASQDAALSLRRNTARPLRFAFATVDPCGAIPIDSVIAAAPDVKLLCMLRDGRDIVAGDARSPSTLIERTNAWIRTLRAAMRAKELRGDAVKFVRYEDLVLETTRAFAGICRWLGIAGDAAHVHGAIEACRIRLAAAVRPGAWRTKLTEGDRIAFKRIAGELLIELGYEQDLRW